MTSQKQSNRHSFNGSALADKARIDKRYHQVRECKLSALQELQIPQSMRYKGQNKLHFNNIKNLGAQRQRSNSLPEETSIKKIVSKIEDDASLSMMIPRPRSVSFDPTSKLYIAASENDAKELKRVLESGKANPNKLYLSGVAPLHIAAIDGHLEAMKVLVQYNADINIHDVEGCSPLEFALRGGHFDCASFLIKVGADTKKIVHGLN